MFTALLLSLVGTALAGDVVPRFNGISSCTSVTVDYNSSKIYATCNHDYEYAPAILKIDGGQMSVAQHTQFYYRLNCIAAIGGDQLVYGSTESFQDSVMLTQTNHLQTVVQQSKTGLPSGYQPGQMGCLVAVEAGSGVYFFLGRVLLYFRGFNSAVNYQLVVSQEVNSWQQVLSVVLLNNTLYVAGVKEYKSIIAAFTAESLNLIKSVHLSNATSVESLVLVQDQIYAAGSVKGSSNDTGLTSKSSENAFYGQLDSTSLALSNAKLIGNQTAVEVLTSAFYDKTDNSLYLAGYSSSESKQYDRKLMYVKVGLKSEDSEYYFFRNLNSANLRPKGIAALGSTVVIVGEFPGVYDGFITVIQNGSIINTASDYTGGGLKDPNYRNPLQWGDSSIWISFFVLIYGLPSLIFLCIVGYCVKVCLRRQVQPALTAIAQPQQSGPKSDGYMEIQA
ncbi:hypothetical protein MP228_013102 [Amoeboaphelidium protococcarum]|nr:hypothetical protein MP228_013102 [Amoeboaphelidium protococcarum]